MIIKQWKQIDKKLQNILKKSKRINNRTIDEINDIIPLFKYSELYKYGDIDKLKRSIEDNKEYLKGDVKLKANSVMKKTKLLNIDILEMYLILIYARQYSKYDNLNQIEFESVVTETYNKAYSEVVDNERPPRSQFNTLLDGYLYTFIPALMLTYNEYMIGRVLSDARETVKAITLQLMQNDKETLKKNLVKQFNYYISYNPKNKIQGIGGYNGAIDKIMSYIVNQATLQGYKDAGAEKVRYIAVIDKNTTGVCRSLDMQEFWINKENIFTRDDGFGNIKKYKVMGLEAGINLPPIVPPPHPCRSMIEYVKVR